MPFKKWELPKTDNQQLIATLAEECGVSELVASVLVARGHFTYDDAARFLTESGELASPFELADMDKAAERIRQAIDDFEKITIYGDYDCDGVTATAMLYTYLSSVGADVAYYIPERDGEGYGMNMEAIRKIAEDGTRLLVTVDNGVSALNETAYAGELGMEVVITDHHQPGEHLPDAFAVVDPHRNDDQSGCHYLCGAGVVFKLIAALEDGDYQTALEHFADVVTLGTIGDIVPLVGENRALVQRGLQALRITDNIGLLALIEQADVKIETMHAQTVAFSLVPRINAAGRMGSAGLAVQLLLSEDPEEARVFAEEMDAKNKERQAEEQEIISSIEEMILQDRSLLTNRLLILKNEHWNHGVIGIACSRLLERFGKPVLLLTAEGDGSYRGSGRSLGEFHLFQALSANSRYLQRFGGHKLAAGFSLLGEDFTAFCQGMESYAREYFDLMPPYRLSLDKVLSPQDLTVEQIGSLSVLEPFGAQNDSPLFLLKNAVLESVTPLSGDKHQRLGLKMGGVSVTALFFGVSSDQFLYKVGQVLDFAVTADVNEYNGKRSVSLKVKDIRPAGFAQDKFFNAKGYYEKMCRSEPIPKPIAARSVPSREELALVYRFLKSHQGYQGDIDCLYVELLSTDINYCKLRILLDILSEAGLIAISPLLNEVRLLPADGKADLNETPTRQRLRTLYGV